MKQTFLALIIIALIAGGVWLIFKQSKPLSNSPSQCETKEMSFYYLEQCSWCQKVKNEGTIDKIEKLGVKVNKINVSVGPIRHKFEGVPTFVIGEKIYSGYKTFEELKGLLRCSKTESQFSGNQGLPQSISKAQFFGEKGESVILENGEIKLPTSIFNDGKAKFYNVKMFDGKTIYFFVIKDKNGNYRAAANACQVCFKTYKGFRYEGNEIVCNNCGNRYPIEKIATEKGSCNPGPINPNLEVENGQVIISQSDLEKVVDLF